MKLLEKLVIDTIKIEKYYNEIIGVKDKRIVNSSINPIN